MVQGLTIAVNSSLDDISDRVARVEERMDASSNANERLFSGLQATHDRLVEQVRQMAANVEVVGKIRPFSMPGSITKDGPRESFNGATNPTIIRIHVDGRVSVPLDAIRRVIEPILETADLKECDGKIGVAW